MDESCLVEPPADPLAELLAARRALDRLSFDLLQAQEARDDAVKRAADLESALLDAALAVAREAHRDVERRVHWAELLRRINMLLG